MVWRTILNPNKPDLTVFPAIHPTKCKPCGYCGEVIQGYSKVARLRVPSCMTAPEDILLHIDCLPLFAAWIGEVAARL
jgi:hypothetical protein